MLDTEHWDSDEESFMAECISNIAYAEYFDKPESLRHWRKLLNDFLILKTLTEKKHNENKIQTKKRKNR